MTILSQPVYRGFGPTLAAEYLDKKHEIEASKETVRQWMIGSKVVAGAEAAKSRRCTCGGRGGAVSESWCSGTPASTTGWRVAGKRSCT